jgi:hypothetical protein
MTKYEQSQEQKNNSRAAFRYKKSHLASDEAKWLSFLLGTHKEH